MPKQLYVSELEEHAPVNFQHQTPQSWFNRYGGFIIETRWNPSKNQYDTIYHPYDFPNTKNMPDE